MRRLTVSLFAFTCCLLVALPAHSAKAAAKTKNKGAVIDFVARTKKQTENAPPQPVHDAIIRTSPDLQKAIRSHLDTDVVEAVPDDGSKTPDELKEIWNGAASDVTVLPETPPKQPVGKTKGDAKTPPKVNVQLRQQQADKDKKKPKKTPEAKKPAVVKMPAPKPAAPVLTRRQVLEREINRERAALRSAQTQLNAAKRSGNAKQINKWSNAVKDRELNIKAIEREIIR